MEILRGGIQEDIAWQANMILLTSASPRGKGGGSHAAMFGVAVYILGMQRQPGTGGSGMIGPAPGKG